VKKSSGDSVGNGPTATPELKAKEPVPGGPEAPQIKPKNAVPDNGNLTPGSGR
jgi:hypothetical protein